MHFASGDEKPSANFQWSTRTIHWRHTVLFALSRRCKTGFPLFQRNKSLTLKQHGNSLTELYITEFVDMVIKREFLINCDT